MYERLEMRRALKANIPIILVRSLALSAILALIAGMAWAARRKPQVIWQESQTPCVQLAVRDKQGTLGTYTATFRVSAPDGLEYVATKTVAGQDWGKAYFPSDFVHREKNGRWWEAWITPGKYSWVGIVNGKEVISGKFEVSTPRLVKGVHIQSVTTLDPL